MVAPAVLAALPLDLWAIIGKLSANIGNIPNGIGASLSVYLSGWLERGFFHG
jgi:hypothetical protein